jgi:hypothetical protein
MGSLAKQRLEQLFICKDNTTLYFSRNYCEWRDLYGKCAYNADHEGYPVNSGMTRIAGEFQGEGFELVRGKFAALDEAKSLIRRNLFVDGSEELKDGEETIHTVSYVWASDVSECGEVDHDTAHTEIYNHLCQMLPDYA